MECDQILYIYVKLTRFSLTNVYINKDQGNPYPAQEKKQRFLVKQGLALTNTK